MALMSEFQKERDAVLKHGTPKEKIAYIWEYYKWHIIIPLVVIVIVITFIINAVTAPNVLLNGVLLNVYPSESSISGDELLADFYKEQNIDTKKDTITLNSTLYYNADDITTNYQSSQALMAWTAAGQVDFITGDYDTLTELSYRGYFMDLLDFLTEEQLCAYEPYFLYMDKGVYTERLKQSENLEDVSDITYPDCDKPESMTDPIPVLIDMKQSEKLTAVYGSETKSLAIGFVGKGEGLSTATIFLDYLLECTK